MDVPIINVPIEPVLALVIGHARVKYRSVEVSAAHGLGCKL